jgi:hypothetical protein
VNFDAVDFVEYFNLTADNWQMMNLWNTSVNLFTPHIQTHVCVHRFWSKMRSISPRQVQRVSWHHHLR